MNVGNRNDIVSSSICAGNLAYEAILGTKLVLLNKFYNYGTTQINVLTLKLLKL